MDIRRREFTGRDFGPCHNHLLRFTSLWNRDKE